MLEERVKSRSSKLRQRHESLHCHARSGSPSSTLHCRSHELVGTSDIIKKHSHYNKYPLLLVSHKYSNHGSSGSMIAENEAPNFTIFQDCLSTSIIQRLAPDSGKTTKKRPVKGRKNEIKPVLRPQEEIEKNDAAELSDFIEVGPRNCCRQIDLLLKTA